MNKSKELAKLLKIKGVWGDCCNNNNKCEYKKINKCVNRESWINCDNGIDGYILPDLFGKYENVMKLYEIVGKENVEFYSSMQGLKCALFGDTGFYIKDYKASVTDLFLGALICQLNGDFIKEDKKQIIIELAQQTKWEY